MVQVNLIRQQLKTVEFVCNITQNKQLKIENTFSFHVAYAEQNTRCRAHLQRIFYAMAAVTECGCSF